MKKTILLLGTFAFLMAAPSYAQEESKKETKQVEAQPRKLEKAKVGKATLKKKRVEKKTISKRKVEPLHSTEKGAQKATKTKPSSAIRIEEKKD